MNTETKHKLTLLVIILMNLASLNIVSANDKKDAHLDLYLKEQYPSATQCATCHPRQYREWSVSQHAYAQLSPVYMAMQTSINLLTSGTNGDFCLRCHTPIGTQIEEPLALANLDRHHASREGITCITCHRVADSYGKISGRLSIEQGDITAPVKGPLGSEELERVLKDNKTYRNLSTDTENNRGKKVHAQVDKFFQMTDSDFCGTCHDVNLVNGFRLEEALSDYRTSPASANNVTCQDCHMGKIPGKDSGYHQKPAAKIGPAETNERRATNHYFAGPDHSIIHPGIFPHINSPPRNLVSKTLRDWLEFDVESGWGDKDLENKLPDDYQYPEAWKTKSHRKSARKLILEQCELLDWAQEQRIEVLTNALKLGTPEIAIGKRKTKLTLPVINQSSGHNIPTGFDAERLVFIELKIKDNEGQIIFESGMRDPNGDLLDLHSSYVAAGKLALDKQLFNLQSKFLTRLARGGEREQVLAINTSLSAQPFIRPETRPTIIYGQPLGARKHRQVIRAEDQRNAKYKFKIPANARWPIKVEAKLIWQMVPVNLVNAISLAGFDYELSAKEVADRVIAGALNIDQLMMTVDQNSRINIETELVNQFKGCTATAFKRSECHFSTPVCKKMSP